MFERFTGKARHAIVLAQEEARLLSHNYIGTEHILLGLLGEPDSVAGTVLASFQLTRDPARAEVEDKVGRGKKSPSGHIPFTPRAKKTLELSLREALSLGHNYIGTEHILLGLIREGDGVAAQILTEHGGLAEIRAAVVAAVPAASEPGSEEGTEETNAVLRWLRHRLSRQTTSVPFRLDVAPGAETVTRGTPAVEAALQHAAFLAGPQAVGSHHLLLASLEDPNSAASASLASLGVDLDELRARLRSADLAGTSDEPPEQAGRRQMAIEVSPELLRVVLTDPVIVRAGNRALRALNAASGETSATASVIQGDQPAAAGLAKVWRELHETLATLASVAPAEEGKPDAEPGEEPAS
jgi:ATP-dependent Clp protease ATP-binding subunit ClpC